MPGSRTKLLDTTPKAGGEITRLAYAHAKKKGAGADLLLRKAGLSAGQINDPGARIEVRRQIKFLNLVAEALDDDLLGFHLSQSFDLRRAGLLHYVLASSDTLNEALQRAARYSSIVNEGIRLALREGREIGLALEYIGVSRLLDRHQIEFWMAALMRSCRELTRRHLTADGVSFAHRRTRVAELRSFYRCQLRFGTDGDEMTFASSIRNTPIVSADPYLNKLLISYCEEALAHRETNRSTFGTSVENTIAVLLPHGKAQVREVARKLNMSRRTLARRLAAEGQTFNSVLRELRSDLAERRLGDQGLPISKIAWLLGYRDISAFSHAYKRWAQTTPRAARQRRYSKRKKVREHASD